MAVWDHLTTPAMTDLIFVATAFAFFALSALYTRFCGSL
jgi:hypothetical protein